MKLAMGLFCCGGLLSALPAPTQVIQTETREVLLDVIVTARNGVYVPDLTAKDFRISQDGKEQIIKGFTLESAAATAQRRSLVLFFDETSMEPRDQVLVRQAAASFIDAEAGPNHMLAIVTFNGSARIVQNFTDNAGRLKDALNQANFHGLAPSTADSDRSRDLAPVREDSPSASSRASGNTAATSFLARDMIRSLADLGRSLDALPGRKIVIVFTGTLPFSSDQKSELKDAVEAANKSGVAFYPVDVRPVLVQTDPGDSLTPQQRSPYMIRGAGPVSAPQGDSDGLGSPLPDSGSSSQQTLYGLANGTGGFVVRNTSELLAGLQNIAKEQDQYYTLTYVPPDSKEGSCHTLRVKVDRKGTSVRSRSSYCTTKPLDLLAGTTAAKELEKRAAATQTGDIVASIQLPYFYAAPNVARVHVAIDIQPATVKFENKKGKLHAELNFLGVAAGTDGEVRARFSDTLKLDFDDPSQIERLKGKPLHYEKEFKIVPGQYTLTIAFSPAGQSDGSFGKLQAPLAVDSWTGGFGLSGLALSRETHPAADLGLGLGLESSTPLVADGVQVVPSGSSQFTKSDAALFYFEVYGPGAAASRVRARILDRVTGDQKYDGGFLKLPTQDADGKASIAAGAKLPIDSLSPGSYRLEVTATDSTGKIQRTADFEIK